ncbi:MAG: hypothetical protein IJW42_02285, partial [Alistipes sp.]|nr:hypothetical protein [Alistipes sp.]
NKICAMAVAAVLTATAGVQSIWAQEVKTFEQVRAMAVEDKTTVTESVIIEGVVISDCESPNMDINHNVSTAKTDITHNMRTAYIQTPDGALGFRLKFVAPEDNGLYRYGTVRLDLKGATIVKEYNPERYTIRNLTSENVLSFKKGDASKVVRKEKHIKDLTDTDVYTFVTLKDLEFVFKDGSYTNIWEPYCIKSELHNVPKPYGVTSRMDSWATLLRDLDNKAIYMHVNTLCQWRRNGKTVPKGMVEMNGIIVSSENRRYGGNMGKFQIRPVDEKDIVPVKGKSPYKTIVGWFYEANNSADVNYEMMGFKTGQGNKREVKGDRLIAEYGKGFMWTTSNSFFVLTHDYNDVTTHNRGSIWSGAIAFEGPTTSWYIFDSNNRIIGTNSVFVEFSTAKISGTAMSVCFDFGAGNQSADSSWQYPAQWKVECCYDGRRWITLKDTATDQLITNMRPVPFWPARLKLLTGDRRVKPTGYDCGLGLQQHTYALPPAVFGCDKVLIRITPANGKLAQIRSNPASDMIMDKAIVTPNCKQTTFFRFGSLYVYYK